MLLAALRMSGVEQRNTRAAAILLLNKKREWKQRMKESSRKRWKEQSESRRRAKQSMTGTERGVSLVAHRDSMTKQASSTAVSSEWRSMACACSWLLIAGRCCRLLAALQQQAPAVLERLRPLQVWLLSWCSHLVSCCCLAVLSQNHCFFACLVSLSMHLHNTKKTRWLLGWDECQDTLPSRR